jgi:hypothetical protein
MREHHVCDGQGPENVETINSGCGVQNSGLTELNYEDAYKYDKDVFFHPVVNAKIRLTVKSLKESFGQNLLTSLDFHAKLYEAGPPVPVQHKVLTQNL